MDTITRPASSLASRAELDDCIARADAVDADFARIIARYDALLAPCERCGVVGDRLACVDRDAEADALYRDMLATAGCSF